MVFTSTGVFAIQINDDRRMIIKDIKSVVTRKLTSFRNKKHLMKTVHGIDISEV